MKKVYKFEIIMDDEGYLIYSSDDQGKTQTTYLLDVKDALDEWCKNSLKKLENKSEITGSD